MNDKLLDEAQEYLKIKGVLDQNMTLDSEQRDDLEELIEQALAAFKPKKKPKMKHYLVTAEVRANVKAFDPNKARAEFAKMMKFVGIEAWTFGEVKASES